MLLVRLWRQVSTKAAANKSIRWSVIDSQLWLKTFTVAPSLLKEEHVFFSSQDPHPCQVQLGEQITYLPQLQEGFLIWQDPLFYLGMALSQNAFFFTEHLKNLQFWHVTTLSFFSQTGLAPTFPMNEDILINFSICMAGSVQHSTTKDDLSAIMHHHSRHSYDLNLLAFLCLQLILHGINGSQGVNSKTRRPIALHILNLFYNFWNVKYTTSKDSLMVETCLFSVFFILGNLPPILTSILNVTLHFETWCSCLSLHLFRFKVSKTDPFRKRL